MAQVSSLIITVIDTDNRETSYVFDEWPVLIGRSPRCHLSICHEAVPRELCSAWLKSDGRTVRVEERPGLTNPLLQNGARVSEGVSDTDLELSVGPIRLRFESSSTSPGSAGSKSKRRFRLPLFMIALLLACIVGFATISVGKKRSLESQLEVLPKSPICEVPKVSCVAASGCLERARLLRERAFALLENPEPTLAEQRQALSSLTQAARLQEQAGVPDREGMAVKVEAISRSLETAYKRDLLVLAKALRAAEKDGIGDAALHLRGDLGSCHEEARSWLERLANWER